MNWQDEGYLLSKNNYTENSIIIEVFTNDHGKYSGIVYGGSSRKQKRIFQIGNKIFLNLISKTQNRSGYFNVELIKPITPLFVDNKKKSACMLSAVSILKILLPERQTNKIIYNSFEKMISSFNSNNWIFCYIEWELLLIKQLGYEIDLSKSNSTIKLNDKLIKVPEILFNKNTNNFSKNDIKEALIFNRNLLIENFIAPNQLRYPFFRNLLENYYI